MSPFYTPFKIAPWATYEPAPATLEELHKNDILVAPTGSLWSAGRARSFRGRMRVRSARGALRYIKAEELHEWQIVVQHAFNLPLDARL